MADIMTLIALGIMFSLLLGLLRVLRGPSAEDRMLAVQLIGTTGVGTLLMLGVLLETSAFIDVALLLALLAAVAAAAFTGRSREVQDD